MNKMEHLEKEV